MSKHTPMTIEFAHTMFAGLFSEEWNVQQQVASLNRLSQSPFGNPDLPMWDFIVIGYEHDIEEYLAVIYSPQNLGRVLDRHNSEDVQEAYFCVLDNYIYNLEEKPINITRLEHDFGMSHKIYCSTPLSEIFDAWVARNQKITLEQNIEHNPIASTRKI